MAGADPGTSKRDRWGMSRPVATAAGRPDGTTFPAEPQSWTLGASAAAVGLLLNQFTPDQAVFVLSVLVVIAAWAWGWHLGRAEGADGGIRDVWRTSSSGAKAVMTTGGALMLTAAGWWGLATSGFFQAVSLMVFVIAMVAYMWFPALPEHGHLKRRARAFSRGSTGALLLVVVGTGLVGGQYWSAVLFGVTAAVVGFFVGWWRSRVRAVALDVRERGQHVLGMAVASSDAGE